MLEYLGGPGHQEGGWSESRLLEAGCLEGTLAVLVMSEWSKSDRRDGSGN